MSPALLPPPLWIATKTALQKLAEELSHHPRLAVDTESNGLHAYREQVCLIQFSTPNTDYLLDPLALPDLSILAPIFANPNIEKTFHAVEYDIICLKRDFGFTIANIFDTMQAARILAEKQVGLDAVLMAKMGITINKRYQKADWGLRPLSPEMLNYARLDTHYLLTLRDLLHAELEAKGRWSLAREEFARLAQGNGSPKPEVPSWQRIGGKQKLTNQQLAILKELCNWRDRLAERMDRPTFKVMDDKRLAEIACAAPATLDDLSRLLSENQRHRFGAEILRAVARGLNAPSITRTYASRPQQAFLNRLDKLSEWRKQTAATLGIESDLVLPKSWMHVLAEQPPKNMEELSAVMNDSPWRIEQFGTEIMNLVGKKG